jgi:hypothetical protein
MHKWRKFITKFCRIFNFFSPIKLEMHSIRPAKLNMLPTSGVGNVVKCPERENFKGGEFRRIVIYDKKLRKELRVMKNESSFDISLSFLNIVSLNLSLELLPRSWSFEIKLIFNTLLNCFQSSANRWINTILELLSYKRLIWFILFNLFLKSCKIEKVDE